MKARCLILPVVLLAITITDGRSETRVPPTWKAGAASAKITPDGPMWMAGYAARTKPSEGVDLDLFAKVLVVHDSTGTKFALVTLDLIGVPRNLRLEVASRVRKELGIDPARLVLNASHTHSGPELRTSKTNAADDPARREEEAAAYTDRLQDTIVRLITEADAKAAPAALDYCSARCGFAMNRRTPDGKGGWNNFPNPAGPVDHAVPVLKVAGADGKEMALVFGYSCHCTTLGLQKFSGDYAGYAQQRLQETHPTAVAMFMNGCSGDQNPYPRNTTVLAETHGRTLATAVEAALTTHKTPLAGTIRAAFREIPLAYDKLPTRDDLLAEKASKDKYAVTHATHLLGKLDADGKLDAAYPYPVQVVRLGDELTWITLGGEVVVDYSLRLKKEIHDPIVWVSGYSNDVMAYIPSLRVWKEGGYEAGGAMKYGTHPTRWSEKAEEHIIRTVFELRKALE